MASVADSITGAPLYMAPEAITHPDSVSPASDLYALGAVAYFLLTGQPVFDGRTVIEICSLHLHQQPTAPSARLGRALPEALERLVLRCLAKSPADRPESAHAFIDE